MRTWVLVMCSMVVACSGGEQPEPAPAPAPAPAPVAAPAPPPPAEIVPMKVPEGANPALLDPSLATEQAPAEFRVKFETTKGEFIVLVHRDWAPLGADRFYHLVKVGFFDNAKFFRAISGFMVQFGISPYPEVSERWRTANLADDPVKEHNTRGRITFATAGPNSRTTQLFINFGDNSQLDGMGFAPFGEIEGDGMAVVDQLFTGYGEGAPRGRGPDQMELQSKGNAYLEAKFPKLDGVVRATLVP